MDTRNAYLFGAIGLAEGLLWYFVAYWSGDFDAGSASAGRAALLFFVSTTLLIARFCWGAPKQAVCAVAAVAIGLVAGGVGYHVVSLIPDGTDHGDMLRLTTWGFSLFAIAYICVAFLQAYQDGAAKPEEEVRFPYAKLFESSWSNVFVGAVALLFAGLLWAILGLWGGLFSVIGIEVFADLFHSAPFRIVASFGSFGVGLALARDNQKVISALRSIAIAISRTLLPVAATVALLFLCALPFTGLQELWDTGYASSLILALLALIVLFTNAAYSSGEEFAATSRWVRGTMGVALLAAPAFALIAAHALWLRVDQYGFTPQRVWAAFFIFLACLYSFGYVLSLLSRSGKGAHGIERVNVASSVLVVTLLLGLHLPLLDPLRISALSQLNRAFSDRATLDEIDVDAIRFRLGHYGERALSTLLDLRDEALTERILAARASEHEWDVMPPDEVVERAEFLAPSRKSDAFLTALRDSKVCKMLGAAKENRCVVFALDLDGDGRLEHCVAPMNPGLSHIQCFYEDTESGWKNIGWANRLGPVTKQDTQPFLHALEAQQVETIEKRWGNFSVGGQRFHLRAESAWP